MMTFDIGAIRKKTDEQLKYAPYHPQKLALLYAGAVLGASLVITLLNLLLQRGIGATGGLSGLGTRSVLETIREVMQTILNLALPFWEFGFLYTALAMARGGDNHPAGLLEGFRRFGSVLRLRIQRGLLYIGIAMVCMYAGSFLFYVTPMAADFVALLEPVLTETATVEQIEAAIAQLPMEQLMGYLWPALAIGGILCALVLIPLYYRFRMADFYVMDDPKMPPMVAMINSARHMRKNRLNWFRLDLHFWWYYLGLLLSVLVCYGDLLLAQFGVVLPMSEDAAWLLSFALGNALLFVLDWLARSRIQTAYALAYDYLRQQEPYTPPKKPVPKNLPWDDYPAAE